MKHRAHAVNDGVLNVRHGHISAEDTRDRRHTAIGDAARHDQAEVIKIRVDVQRESV